MVNYYEEFNLDMSMSTDEICAALAREKSKWRKKHIASGLENRMDADLKIELIEQAVLIFTDKLKREQYDFKLRQQNKKNKGKEQQQTAGQQHRENSAKQESREYSGNDSIETILATAKAYYESGNLNKTIAYCSQMISRGADSPYLHNYLSRAYWENDNLRQAADTYKRAIEKYPDAAFLYANLGHLYLAAINDYVSAKVYIDRALRMEADNNLFLSLEIMYMFYTGDVDAAEEKIKRHLMDRPNDQEYRKCVSYAYLRYSDKFFVECENGGSYIPSQQAYDSILYYTNKAREIYDTEKTRNIAASIQEKGKWTFNKDNKKGIICLFVIGFFFIYGSLSFWLICSGILVYFSYKPNWLIDKMTLTNQRDIVNKFCYYLYRAVSIVLRICYGILEMIGKIFSAIVGDFG